MEHLHGQLAGCEKVFNKLCTQFSWLQLTNFDKHIGLPFKNREGIFFTWEFHLLNKKKMEGQSGFLAPAVFFFLKCF